MERFLTSTARVQENSIRLLLDCQAKFDERLASLPQEITRLINPEAIAALIMESLRQQFDKTAIPETAQLLRSGVDDVNSALVEIRGGARMIGRVLNEATLEANGFLTRVQAACVDGTARVTRAAERMATILNASIGSLMLLACGAGIAVGLMLGILLHDWWTSPAHPVQPAMIQPQTLPVAPPSEARPKTAVHRK